MSSNPHFRLELKLTGEIEKPLPNYVSPEMAKWLSEISEDVESFEESVSVQTASAEEFPPEPQGFEDFQFELVNGNDVKIVFAKFWERRQGVLPAHYYAIRLYSTEGTLRRSMALHCEFRAGYDFGFVAVPHLWEWLAGLVDRRSYVDFDDLGQFIEEFEAAMMEISDVGLDAVEHLEHLPEISDPEAFDKVDDSMFNDQNGGEPDRLK